VLAYKRWLLLLMGALALMIGAAKGAASLASPLVVRPAKPTIGPHRSHRVDPRRIAHLRALTWRWQRVMGRRLTKRPLRPSTLRNLHAWQRIARRAYNAFVDPPHEGGWLCIHRYEASWRDSGEPYWGGLQMDRRFMEFYAPKHLLRRGWANRWSPLEQMWVAENAYQRGRGFYAWPSTARLCGLI
jgi:hypothetical protein